MTNLEKRDISSPEHKRDPFPFYAKLRSAEQAIQVTVPGIGKAWLITRYDDVIALLQQDSVFVKDPRNADAVRKLPWWLPASVRAISRQMINVDNPEHRRLRDAAEDAFKRRRIAEMKPRIAQIACDLLDVLAEANQPDFVSGFAVPFPLMVTCELLGLPTTNWSLLHKWSRQLIESSSLGRMLPAFRSMSSFSRYLRGFFEQRRSQPKDDLISALLFPREAQNALSADELLAMVVLLIMAGSETTANLLGSGMLALFEDPKALRTLREEPKVMRSAVEEFLRYTAPIEIASERHVVKSAVLHGCSLEPGDRVLAVIASANRDEHHFTDADQLDIRRNPAANVPFGSGIHHCIGFHLAKLEAEIAFSLILQRFPDIRLGCDLSEIKWKRDVIARGLSSLPVKLR